MGEGKRVEFIDALAQQLNLDSSRAQALAGGVLGVVENALRDRGESDAATRFESAIPELSGWKREAEAFMGADAPDGAEGGLGGLLGSALGSLGGSLGGGAGAVALLAPLLGKLGISETHIQTVVPLVTQFLGQRLDGSLLDQVKAVLPFLSDDGGGVGILGGLLG